MYTMINFINVIKITSLVIFWACSTPKIEGPTEKYPHVDRKALEHVKAFEEHYGEDLGHVKIAFKDFGNVGYDGVCDVNFGRQIYLDINAWKVHSYLEKQLLVFHELGHCVLDREHVQYNEHTEACPPSIMGYMGISEFCFRRDRQYYIDELFRRLK